LHTEKVDQQVSIQTSFDLELNNNLCCAVLDRIMNGKDNKIGAGKKRAPPPSKKTAAPKSNTDTKSAGRNQYQNLKNKKVSFDAEGNEDF